jgi:hypothetical protein
LGCPQKKRFTKKENVGKKNRTERKQKNNSQKKFNMPLRRAFFEVKQKAIATGGANVFFLLHFGRNQRVGNNKRTNKKRKGLLLFFLFQVSK